MTRALALAVGCVCASVGVSAPSHANKGCTDVQSRCAMQIGGRCDPVTGRWEYGRNGAGGNTHTFTMCLDRNTAGKKK
jgi:hypothetical protein